MLSTIVIGVLVIVGLASLGTANSTNSPATTNGSETSATVSSDSAENQTQSGPASSFGDGTFIVNTDIQPGTYKSSGGENCYYARLSGFGGTNSEIISNEDTSASAIVTIAASDKGFTSSGCGTWTKVSIGTSGVQKNTTQTKVETTPTTQATAPAPTTTYITPNGASVNASGNVVAPPSASWHTVATYSGSDDTNTNTFTIQGSKWRVDWSITPNAGAESYCQQNSCSADFQIYADDGSYVDQLVGTGTGTANGSSYEYNKTGNFYFSVVPGNVSWNLTVEDYY